MAGDWVKMRTGLRRHPKVVAMSRHLAEDARFVTWWSDRTRHTREENVTESVTESVTEIVTRITVCGLLEVWGAVNAADKGDGYLPYMEEADIDEIVGMPGFGKAMVAIGWARRPEGEGAQGIVFPNFCELNTPGSKRGQVKSDAQRAREYRERKKARQEEESQRHERHVTSRIEEKRRESKNNTSDPPDPTSLELTGGAAVDTIGQKFESLWQSFPADLGAKGSKTGAEAQFRKLKPDDLLLGRMRRALAAQIEHKRAARIRGEFFENFQHVERWLRKRRWEDEIPDAPSGEQEYAV